MREDIKARWTARLRSGREQQGVGYLKRVMEDDGQAYHCCLGVLCEIAVEDGIVLPSKPRHQGSSIHYYPVPSDEEVVVETVLPHVVAAWAEINQDGIQERSGKKPPCADRSDRSVCANRFCGNCRQLELTVLNDGVGDRAVTFEQIADVIEKWF